MKSILFIIYVTCISFGVYSQSSCARTVRFGDINICLPVIAGMTECYEESNIKPVADGMSYPGNSIIAMYFRSSDYRRIEELDYLDDYVQVFATDKMAYTDITNSILDEGLAGITGTYLAKSWEQISSKLDSKSPGLEFGQPIVVDNYSLTQNSRTAVLLTPMSDGSGQTFMLMTINLVNLKGRLIYFSHYLNYIGPKTIEKLKAKNDYFLMILNKEN